MMMIAKSSQLLQVNGGGKAIIYHLKTHPRREAVDGAKGRGIGEPGRHRGRSGDPGRSEVVRRAADVRSVEPRLGGQIDPLSSPVTAHQGLHPEVSDLKQQCWYRF